MNALHKLLVNQITQTGPVPISQYMAECLLHPKHGYYTTRNPLGAPGDFTTAPEISQMFGELVGLALAQAWLDQGAPSPFVLAELGPGTGTLMADALRATKAVPGFHSAMQIWLVEASPVLRESQMHALTGYNPNWADQIADLPTAPHFIIANEFFDALPIRQYLRKGAGWAERLVGLSGKNLTFGLGAPGPVAGLEHRLADTTEDDLVETCAPGAAILNNLAARINLHGGAALIIDYGNWGSLGDTFQAISGHAFCAPLENPGKADLTAHVDFRALAKAADPLVAAQLVPQGVFLERLGITDRARALAKGLSGAALETHIAAHKRLTYEGEMGTLFKVLGLTPAGAPPIAGTSLEP